ncbi:hypothetical protein ONZ45_g2463 [Pleurotus djamor]|nr:hypothetical protein ONZ45_g2463 [Pleurotus djamor]
MASSIWNSLCQLWLAFWNFLLTLFKKPRHLEEEAPPILPITLHRDDNAEPITSISDIPYRPAALLVEDLPTGNSGEFSWNDIDASRTDYHSEITRNNIADGPADWDRQATFDVYRLDKAVLSGLNTTSAISKYPFSVPKDFSLTGRIPGVLQKFSQSTQDLVVDAETFALSQLRTQKIREAVTELKLSRTSFDSSAFLDVSCDKDSSQTSTNSFDESSDSPDFHDSKAVSQGKPIRDVRAERREIMINFSQFGTYSHSTLSASSTSVLGDFSSSSGLGMSRVECIPLPTGFEPRCEECPVPLGRATQPAQRKAFASMASYPDPSEMSLESLEPNDAFDEYSLPPLHGVAKPGVARDTSTSMPAPEASPPGIDHVFESDASNAAPTVPSHNPIAPAASLPEKAAPLPFIAQSARLYSNVKMADTPDRDRYRGAAYSKPVLKLGASSPSLSESSLTYGSPPPIAIRPAVYISPTTTPILASSPVMNAKPRTIRIVHDMTRSPVSLWQEPQRSSATAQENVVPGSKVGNTRRRKTQSPQKGSSVGSKSATKYVGSSATIQHSRRSESISKTTGCSVNPSISSPGVTV